METVMLCTENVEMLVEFEKQARETEADIFIHAFDETEFKTETLKNLKNPHFDSAKCLMCVDEEKKVIGRLDFSIIPSFAFGGDIRTYVDWVYILKECRHKGVAQFLFGKMEAYLKELGINEYFLIAAENDEAQRFYRSLGNAEIAKQDVLTKAF